MTLAEAQANLAAANETYLSLVRATRPFSRTQTQDLKIQNAYLALELAREHLRYAKQEARNVLR